MLNQRRKEQLKEYEKQEKRLRELKLQGLSSKKAVEKSKREVATRKQAKGKQMLAKSDDQSAATPQLLTKPKEYVVKVGRLCNFSPSFSFFDQINFICYQRQSSAHKLLTFLKILKQIRFDNE